MSSPSSAPASRASTCVGLWHLSTATTVRATCTKPPLSRAFPWLTRAHGPTSARRRPAARRRPTPSASSPRLPRSARGTPCWATLPAWSHPNAGAIPALKSLPALPVPRATASCASISSSRSTACAHRASSKPLPQAISPRSTRDSPHPQVTTCSPASNPAV